MLTYGLKAVRFFNMQRLRSTVSATVDTNGHIYLYFVGVFVTPGPNYRDL